jgi:hypothetical protein
MKPRVTWIKLVIYSGRVFGCQSREACGTKITEITGTTTITEITGTTTITEITGTTTITEITGTTTIMEITGTTTIMEITGTTTITTIPQIGKKGHIRNTKNVMIFLPDATGNLMD